VSRTRGQPFRTVQTETHVRVPVGIPLAVRRAGRRRVDGLSVALEISQVQRLDSGGYAVLGALLQYK